MPKLLAALALVALSALASCTPKPGQGPGLGSPGIISCAEQSIVAAAPEGLGPVNACLSGDSDITACLLGLIQPATKFTIGLVGCLTKHEGSAASAASHANPGDAVDKRRAQRAHEFLDGMQGRGFVFSD